MIKSQIAFVDKYGHQPRGNRYYRKKMRVQVKFLMVVVCLLCIPALAQGFDFFNLFQQDHNNHESGSSDESPLPTPSTGTLFIAQQSSLLFRIFASHRFYPNMSLSHLLFWNLFEFLRKHLTHNNSFFTPFLSMLIKSLLRTQNPFIFNRMPGIHMCRQIMRNVPHRMCMC